MTNINWSSFITNLAGNNNRVASGVVNNVQEQEPAAQQNSQNLTADMLLPNTMQQLARSSAELAMLNQQQTVNMLKELLSFPKNFEQLLSQLTTNNQTLNQQTILMLLASSLDLSKLSSMLQNNAKEAMSNLYQMLAGFNQIGLSLKDEQLSELTKLITFVAASSSSDVQSLKTTILMYLPWLPLTDPDAFKLEIASKGSNSESDSDDSITVLISTINYGSFQADIYKTSQDGIRIDVTSSETFPVNLLDELMKRESKKYNININMSYVKKQVFNKNKNEQLKTQVVMNTSPGVNPFLLAVSSSLVKNVHEIDEKENIKETRKEKLK